MSRIEELNRKITDKFMDGNKFEISLRRYPKVKTPSGGWKKGEPEMVTPQFFTLVKNSQTDTPLTTGDGAVRSDAYTLVGQDDADVKRSDEFEYDNKTFVILSVDKSRHAWATRAVAIERSDEPF